MLPARRLLLMIRTMLLPLLVAYPSRRDPLGVHCQDRLDDSIIVIEFGTVHDAPFLGETGGGEGRHCRDESFDGAGLANEIGRRGVAYGIPSTPEIIMARD